MKAALLVAVVLASRVAAAQEDPCASCIVVQAPPRVSSLLLEYDLGGAYTYALGRSFTGARFDFAVGREWASGFTLDGRFGIEAGGSESGLPYQRVSWGMGIGGRVASRVRIAVEPRLGGLFIDRATEPGPSNAMSALTFGVNGEVVVALTGPGPRAARERMGGLDLIARVGYDGWLIDDINGLAPAVTCKLALGGHF